MNGAFATAANATSASSQAANSLKNDEIYEDDKKLAAPIELLSEFLSALMLRDYGTALTHCKTILIYEPENQTALEFFPLIQQRLTEAEEASSGSSSSSDDEDMISSRSDEDDVASWAATSSDDEYSTADNSLWTASTVTDSESSIENDEKTEVDDEAVLQDESVAKLT